MVYIFFCFIVHVCWFDEDNKMNMLTCKKCLLHVSRISVLPKISVQYFSHICSLCWGGGEIKVTITYNLMLLKNFNTNISVVVWEIHRVHMSLDCFSIICCSVCYLFAENDFRERLFFSQWRAVTSVGLQNWHMRLIKRHPPLMTMVTSEFVPQSTPLQQLVHYFPQIGIVVHSPHLNCRLDSYTGNQNGCWYAVQDVKSAFELISRQESD